MPKKIENQTSMAYHFNRFWGLVPYLMNHLTENYNIFHGEYNPVGQQLKLKWAQSEMVSMTDWLILTVIGSYLLLLKK